MGPTRLNHESENRLNLCILPLVVNPATHSYLSRDIQVLKLLRTAQSIRAVLNQSGSVQGEHFVGQPTPGQFKSTSATN